MAKTKEPIDPFFADISGADTTTINDCGADAVSALNRARKHPHPDNLTAATAALTAFCNAVNNTVRISARMSQSESKGKGK